MIINDKILIEYASLSPLSLTPMPPKPFKPAPTTDDYRMGMFTRCAIIKRNDSISGYEIDPRSISAVSSDIFRVFTFSWRIIGKRNRVVVNGIVEDFGVEETNRTTVNKLSTDLHRIFSNPLEFWQGY